MPLLQSRPATWERKFFFSLIALVPAMTLWYAQERMNMIFSNLAAMNVNERQINGTSNEKLLVFIGYMTSPESREKRDSLRHTCFPKIRSACMEYNERGVDTSIKSRLGWGKACDVRFFVGHPNDPSRDASTFKGRGQGKLATDAEITLAQSLQAESDQFGDIQILPLRDSHVDRPHKTLSILRHGVESGAEIVMKIDDDQCPDIEKVLGVARSTPHNVARYVGGYHWKGTEYESMKGADGSIDPYMSGKGYLVSKALAKAVSVDDINHSVLYMLYGSSSEDVDMGKWFAYAKQTHPELVFVSEVVPDLTVKHVPLVLSENNKTGKLLVFVGYLSAPGNKKKRNWLRKTCFPKIQSACLEFDTTTKADNNAESNALRWGTACQGRFFIGQPNDPQKELGALATDAEISLAQSLQAESDQFGDIQMIPFREAYIELPDKTISILRHGVYSGAEAVLKIDDDQCPDIEKVLGVARSTPHNVARYVGGYHWKGTEYESMKGADGSIDPYMSGPGYLVSKALAKVVSVDDINHSILHMSYGSSSEDVDMGKWFAYAKQTHPELVFVSEVAHGLTVAHEEHPKEN